jgi:hypothetical protein
MKNDDKNVTNLAIKYSLDFPHGLLHKIGYQLPQNMFTHTIVTQYPHTILHLWHEKLTHPINVQPVPLSHTKQAVINKFLPIFQWRKFQGNRWESMNAIVQMIPEICAIMQMLEC